MVCKRDLAMARQLWCAERLIHRPMVLCVLVLLALGGLAGRPSGAAELADQAHSLRLAPADVAFYSASLRLKEQVNLLLQSKAYARLMEIPVIQIAKMQAMFQWQQSTHPTISRVRDYVQSPEGQQAVAVLGEMFSEETFLFVGDDVVGLLKLLLDLNGIQRTARIEATATGRDAAEVMVEQLWKVLQKRSDEFQVPTLVWGCRVQDAQRARRQLDAVHSLVRNLLDKYQSEFSAHLQREQIAGQEFLTLRLDGSMIPWEQIRAEADDEAQVEEWRKLLSDKTLSIALGVMEEFVILSLGDSTDHLEKLRQGPFLASHPALSPLARHADQRLVSLSYLSESLARSLSSPEQTLEDLAGTVDEILQQAEISDEHRQLIVEDIQSLKLAKYMPTPGSSASVAYLTPRGYETFQYDAGTQPMMDSSKPLTILNHVGGSPMAMVASRSNDTVEDYDEAVAWLRRTARHVEQIVESKADPDDWAKYMKYRDRIVDLLRRLNTANREHLYPAMADNQGALVLDVAAESQQWFAQLPKSPKPLPMFEMGVVASVSDAEHLRQGVKEYFAVVRDAIKLMREIEPDEVPEFDLPPPRRHELEGGIAVYEYSLPAAWGVDSQIALNGGMTQNAAAFSTMPATTQRLLQSTALAVDTAIDLNRPAAMAVHCNFKKMSDAIRPWIHYGLDIAMGKLKTDPEEEEDEETPSGQNPYAVQLGFIVPQLEQLLDIIGAVRSASSVTYFDEGNWVTHSEIHIEDLK